MRLTAADTERRPNALGRTHHEALPVLKGTKYAANFWLHQYDYISAHNSGCTT